MLTLDGRCVGVIITTVMMYFAIVVNRLSRTLTFIVRFGHIVIIIAVGERIIGILVDAVSDILTVGTEEIKPAPTADIDVDDAYIEGLISVDEKMVVLLDAENLFSADTIEQAESAAKTSG